MKLIMQHPLFGLDDLMLCSYPVLNTLVPGKCLQSLMESNKSCIGLIYIRCVRQIKKDITFHVIDIMSGEKLYAPGSRAEK